MITGRNGIFRSWYTRCKNGQKETLYLSNRVKGTRIFIQPNEPHVTQCTILIKSRRACVAVFIVTVLTTSLMNALKSPKQVSEGRYSDRNVSALTVPEMITRRRNARAEERACTAKEDTTPLFVTKEPLITR